MDSLLYTLSSNVYLASSKQPKQCHIVLTWQRLPGKIKCPWFSWWLYHQKFWVFCAERAWSIRDTSERHLSRCTPRTISKVMAINCASLPFPGNTTISGTCLAANPWLGSVVQFLRQLYKMANDGAGGDIRYLTKVARGKGGQWCERYQWCVWGLVPNSNHIHSHPRTITPGTCMGSAQNM